MAASQGLEKISCLSIEGWNLLTQSDPFLYSNECGMAKVAEITPPLRPREGLALRGSVSESESLLFVALVKLIRRNISRSDFAPDAASVGDCAMLSRNLVMSWEK